MAGRFTRTQDNSWVIATQSDQDAHSKVMIDRKYPKLPTPMQLGACTGTKTIKGSTWYLYEIDRSRGGKAPTSGRMGENPNGKGGTPGQAPVPQPAPEQPKPEMDPATRDKFTTVDLSAYAKTTYVDNADSAIVESMMELRKMIDEKAGVTITIADVAKGTLRELEGITHKALPDILACLAAGVHVYVVGPAGSGKTHLATSAADALGRTLYICGAMLTKHEVTGYMGATGQYVSTAARDAFENGGVLLWDEVDASMPAALVAVNAMLANDTYTFPDKTVKRHPDFVCMAAGNTYGRGADREYVGRLQLDAATLDRFAIVDVDYDLNLERALARAEFKAHGGTEQSTVEGWLDLVVSSRDKAADGGVRHVISPRASIYGARLLARGMTAKRATEIVIRKGLDEDAARQLGVAE
jgi:cobaltochelatase CobS